MPSPLTLFPLAAGTSYLLAILGIGFLIFIHEFGHYLACRLTKTRVETFSIGFGTRLFGWENNPGEPRRFTVGRRRLDPATGAMDFRVALVPLGGYVKMAGENPGDERTGSPDEFPSKPMWARVFIISAGVVMNTLTAAVFYFIAFAGHIQQEPAILGRVLPGGAAWEAGLAAGDRVVSVDGTRTRSFQELKMETVFLAPDEPVPIVVDREGETKTFEVTPRYDEKLGAIRVKVEPAAVLVLKRKGQDDLEIGPTEPVLLDGVPAYGGLDAFTRLLSLLRDRHEAGVTLQTADGTRHELRWTPEAAPPDAKPVYKIGIEKYGHPTVKAVRGAAARLFQPGDRILAALAGGRTIPLTMPSAVDSLPWQAPVDHLHLQRGPDTKDLPFAGATPMELAAALEDLELEWSKDAVVGPLEAGTATLGPESDVYRYPSVPSTAAGLVAGDRIVSVAGHATSTWIAVVEAIARVDSAKPLEVAVVGADDTERTLSVVPVALQRLGGPALELRPYREPYQTSGALDAAGAAVAQTGREAKNILRLIGAFFTGRLSFNKNVGGPVTIVKYSAAASERDNLSFFFFLAYISITLAVLNILPIPVLDGGHLMFILIEKIKGSPLKEETLGKLQFVGLMLLLLLMVFAFKNDFQNLFS